MVTYYVEVNLICIIVLLLFHSQLENMATSSTDQRILHSIICTAVFLCLMDIIAGIFRGAMFPYARVIIEASNLLYFEAITLISFLWCVYVHIRLGKIPTNPSKYFMRWGLPLILFTLIALTNPFTHIFFKINAQNLYERNIGVYLHWIIVWGYFLIPSIQVHKAYVSESNKLRKEEIAPLLYFIIAPFIASIIQMLFYGVTSTQAGITISIVMICLTYQNTQILTDALTGINNRRGLDRHLTDCIQHHQNATYTIVMIDVDNFKYINDKYGHMNGDLVLRGIADYLKDISKTISGRLFLCRYGGDEFVILGLDCNDYDFKRLINTLEGELTKNTSHLSFPCDITVSVGMSTSKCSKEDDLRQLLSKADLAMYDKKKIKYSAIEKQS